MNKSKKLIGVVLLAAGGVVGCATSPARLVSRGMVASTTSGTWGIVTGPRTVHAYAGYPGGELYNARATTGTNADCTGPNAGGVAVPVLEPERAPEVIVASLSERNGVRQ